MKRWQKALAKRRAERRKTISLQGTVCHLQYELEREKTRFEMQERRYFELFGYDITMQREMIDPDVLRACIRINRKTFERLTNKTPLIKDAAICLVDHLRKNL